MKKLALLTSFIISCTTLNSVAQTNLTKQAPINLYQETLKVLPQKPLTLRVLLTNDDGCEAFGIQELKKLLEAQGIDVWMVAPTVNQSAAGTAITFKPGATIKFTQLDAKTFCFPGRPSDSVDFAILGLLKNNPPDLVISGVNDGPNTGIAQLNSGTVAAAIRALRYGYPAIAASIGVIPEESNHYFPSTKEFWPDSVAYVAQLIAKLNQEWLKAQRNDTNALILPKGTGLSINYPALPKEAIKGVKYIGNEFYPAPQINYIITKAGETRQEFNPIILKSSNAATDTGYLDQGYITYTVMDGDWNAPAYESIYKKLLPATYSIKK